MATLILSAVGTAVGGPIGGAVGALLGRAFDTAVIGSPSREGPRLTELAVTTSSYGQPVPRVFGTMRLPGTIIWATDLVESSSTSGGKGQPKTTSYSYSISFAVALSSRPVASIGRVWADGALLRGAAGDLKVGGTMRLYHGHGEQPLDPLIAADKGEQACAFRGLAYAVFEDLELGSFGNRIPALSFEIAAGDVGIDLPSLLEGIALAPATAPAEPLRGLTGFADHGGERAALLRDVARVYPLMATTIGDALPIEPLAPTEAFRLPDAVTGRAGGDDLAEPVARRRADAGDTPGGLRYYDPARDFQPSLQRAPGGGGSSGSGERGVVEFAGVFAAAEAQERVAEMRRHALTGRETLSYRIAEPAAQFAPGRCVTRENDARIWRVMASEWHADGADLLLERVVTGVEGTALADPGNALSPPDEVPGEILLRYFELPWDGAGSGNVAQRYAAVSMAGARGGISLSGVEDDALLPLGISARGAAVQGQMLSALGASPALIFEPAATCDIALSSEQALLQSVGERAIFDGANRMLLGEEILHFRIAHPLGNGHWRLTGLLRGRGGTEHHAALGHDAGTAAVLLDENLVALGAEPYAEIAAESGLETVEPTFAALSGAGTTLRPLAPVHPSLGLSASGYPEWRWVRRARGAWRWRDGVDTPLAEERETYRVGLGPVDAPVSQWDTSEPRFSLPAAQWAAFSSTHPGADLWVRQVGSHAVSLPTLLPR